MDELLEIQRKCEDIKKRITRPSVYLKGYVEGAITELAENQHTLAHWIMELTKRLDMK